MSPCPSPNPVRALLEGAAEQEGHAAGAKQITLTVRPFQGNAVFDPRWTGEALGNIVNNAVKYTPAGGAGHYLRPGAGLLLPGGCCGHRPRHPGARAGRDLSPLFPWTGHPQRTGSWPWPLPCPADYHDAGRDISKSLPGRGADASFPCICRRTTIVRSGQHEYRNLSILLDLRKRQERLL